MDKHFKMGVLYVMAHLVITITLVIVYTVALLNGHQDETLKMALIAIIGYWFGAIGKDSIRDVGKKVREGDAKK